MGEVQPGDDLAALLAAALRLVPVGTSSGDRRGGVEGGTLSVEAGLQDGDVLVVTQKVVSKAEGRLVAVGRTIPTPSGA